MRSPSVRVYVLLVAALAAATTAALLVLHEGPLVDRPLLVATIALLIAFEHRFATRIALDDRQGETTTHEEAYIVFLALLEPAPAVLAALGLGFLLANLLARRTPLKVAFNVVAIVAAVAVAMLVTTALGGATGDGAAAAGAAVAGVAVFGVVNRALLSGVLALVGAAPWQRTIADDASGRLLLLATNAAIGLLAGLAARESLAALPLALLAVVVLHFTLAGHGRARAERRKLRDVVEASTNGILVVDERGDVTSWNAACAEITGWSADEICGRPLREVRALLDAEPYEDEHTGDDRYATRIRTREGDLRWLIVVRSPLPEGGDLLLVHDDTARRTVAELRVAQLQERTRADFVAAVSHEFRTPLTSIRGFTSTLLQREVPHDEQVRYLTIVNEQAERLGRLVDDLLDLRSVDPQTLDLLYDDVDVAALVRDEAAAFETESRRRPIGIESDAAPVVVRADRRRIEQVVANLLSNALKYSDDRSPVTLKVESGPDEVRVSVRDRGIGIAERDRERVFTPFFRAGEADVAGTGLGLAICRHIVAAHGGTIGFTSERGVGSEFFVTLPRREPG